MDICAIKNAIANMGKIRKAFGLNAIFSIDYKYDIHIHELEYWISISEALGEESYYYSYS